MEWNCFITGVNYSICNNNIIRLICAIADTILNITSFKDSSAPQRNQESVGLRKNFASRHLLQKMFSIRGELGRLVMDHIYPGSMSKLLFCWYPSPSLARTRYPKLPRESVINLPPQLAPLAPHTHKLHFQNYSSKWKILGKCFEAKILS